MAGRLILMKEFFGFGGYERAAEGYFSWQHLLFVSFLNASMILCAVLLSRRNKRAATTDHRRVLAASAILADALEVFKIVLLCIRHENPLHWLYELPLFMCSILLIAMPLAAFTRGRLQEASVDFVAIFGLLGAVFGTYFAGNNYGSYPVISFDNVVSGLTHAISGFASLYILLSGMATLQKRNIPVTFGIMGGFCLAAYIVNHLVDYNYMFLMRGDGTPYDILYNLTGGSPVWYPLGVIGLFFAYIAVFYAALPLIRKHRQSAASA